MSDESAGTGYTAADTVDPVEFMRMQHRAGKHAGRFRNADCQECYPPTRLATEDTPQVEWGSSTPPSIEAEVAKLWEELNREELARVLPKAVEYGAMDLEIMGFVLTRLLNSPRARSRQWNEAEGEELASWFYALGKVARAFGAFAEGRIPNDDTPHDNGVYSRMIQIIRKRGRWM